jgi:hypothetical protein
MSNTDEEICPVAAAVTRDIMKRATLGQLKYGTNLMRPDLTHRQWLQHLYEELLDGANYIKRVMIDLDNAS